jgi:hypothetical protein
MQAEYIALSADHQKDTPANAFSNPIFQIDRLFGCFENPCRIRAADNIRLGPNRIADELGYGCGPMSSGSAKK